MTGHISRWKIAIGAVACAASAHAQQNPNELFKDVEVRVIRQKYFQKSMRPEFGASFNALMNRSFVYTMLGSANIAFHISEQIGLFGEGGIGFTMNKADCSTLGEKFAIEPIVDDLKNWFGGGIAYTPIYGKYQLSSGDLIYFDWFFTASGGMAGTNKRMYSCIPESTKSESASTQMQIGGSTGQRYFLNKNTAAVWSIKFMKVQDPAGGTVFNGINNVMLSLGASYFL